MGLIRRYINRFTAGGDTAINFKNAFLGYWPLQEPSLLRYDFGNANNLTDNNTVGFSGGGGPGGAYPDAAVFIRANAESLHVADNAELSTGDLDFYAHGWFRLASKPGSDMHMMGKWNATGADREWLLYHNASADRFYFAVSADGTAYSEDVEASALGAPALNTWYFIQVWHSATANELKIRVNGGTANIQAYSGGVTDQAANFRIGASDEGAHFDGRIAGVGFLKGTPTSNEVDAVYNNGVPVSPMSLHAAPFGDDGGFQFPLNLYEWQPAHALRSPIATIGRANYGARMIGGYPAPMAVAQERIRFVKVGTAQQQQDFIDDFLVYVHNFGRGKLWSIGDDGTERWCWAEIAAMPEIDLLSATHMAYQPVVIVFNRFSNWMDKYQTILHLDTGNTGDTILTVPQLGNTVVFDSVLELRGDSWTNPFVNNSPTWLGHLFKGNWGTAQDITTNLHRVELDNGRPRAAFSSDNGQTYADDFGDMNAIPNDQFLFGLALIPGNNFILFNGTRTNTRAVLKFFNQYSL